MMILYNVCMHIHLYIYYCYYVIIRYYYLLYRYVDPLLPGSNLIFQIVHRVVLGDSRTAWAGVEFGVPQGSVLGPIL